MSSSRSANPSGSAGTASGTDDDPGGLQAAGLVGLPRLGADHAGAQVGVGHRHVERVYDGRGRGVSASAGSQA